MGRYLEDLSREEKQTICMELLDKRERNNKKQWVDIVSDFDLECHPETLRKISVGVEFASDAGMKFDIHDQNHIDKAFVERQKIYDMQRKIRQDMREFSRTELICEYISNAIKDLPELIIADPPPEEEKTPTKQSLVIGLGDFHYGAKYNVAGLYGETINYYDSSVFETRMQLLLNEIVKTTKKENPKELVVMIAGDMLDGMLRTSQLQRLEYGVVESAIRLAETLSYWLVSLEEKVNIPIRVYAVRGNHGEIRPLGTKASQFPEENMERIVMHYLFARFDGEKRVKIAQNDAPMVQMIDVCGLQFFLTHGQGTNIQSIARDSVNLYNNPIDVFMVAHLHKSQTFTSGIMPNSNVYVERVPSLCGIDPFAQSKGYGANPGATLMLIEEGYGIRCVYPINLKRGV